jgi:hypothetical protein
MTQPPLASHPHGDRWLEERLELVITHNLALVPRVLQAGSSERTAQVATVCTELRYMSCTGDGGHCPLADWLDCVRVDCGKLEGNPRHHPSGSR